jgi:hypothetical protein
VRWGISSALFLILLVLPASAAAAPANDDFADREVLSGSTVEVTRTNVGATKEEGEHLGAIGPAGHSVWFEWEAPSDGWVTIGACSMDFNGLVGVFTGTELTNLVSVAQGNRNEGPDCVYQGRQYSFEATAGTGYKIAVDGDAFRVEGPEPDTEGTFTLRIEPTGVPANDDFEDALPLEGTISEEPGGARFYFADMPGFNWTAGSEPGEPDIADTAGTTVWYRWTAPESGIAHVSACCALPVRVYAGDALDALTAVAAGWIMGAEFEAIAGQEYAIVVDANLSEPGEEPETSFFELRATMELKPTPQVQPETVTRIETVVTEDRTPPKTTIRWHRIGGGQGATFVLRSNEPGTSFRCRLDGRRLKCRPKMSFRKLSPGRHTFEVSAIDAAGNADPTPAVTHFRIAPQRPRAHS